MTSKIFSYVRVSSKDQNIDRQIDIMRSLGIEDRDIFIDNASGKDLERPQYQTLKAIVRDGDTVVFDSITRLSRNMMDIKKEYEWFNENKINLKFVKEPILDTTVSNDVMKQAINDIILTLLGAFAQQERESIKQRQAEGIKAAKLRGKKFGRPKLELSNSQKKLFSDLFPQWQNGDITATAMMKEVKLKRSTFYKTVKEYESKIKGIKEKYEYYNDEII